MPGTQLAIRDNEYDDVADDASLRECGYDDYIGAMMRIMMVMVKTRVTMGMMKMIMM